MTEHTAEYARDASNRLCFEVPELDSAGYPKLVAQIVEHFDLKPKADLLIGPDQLVGGFSDGNCSIGLDWDIWCGFIVTAHTPDADSLARSIGPFLSDRLDVPTRQ